MAQNEAEIPSVKKLAASVGADALTFKTLNPDNEDFYTRLSSETTEGKMLMPQDTRYRRFRIGPPGGAAHLPGGATPANTCGTIP